MIATKKQFIENDPLLFGNEDIHFSIGVHSEPSVKNDHYGFVFQLGAPYRFAFLGAEEKQPHEKVLPSSLDPIITNCGQILLAIYFSRQFVTEHLQNIFNSLFYLKQVVSFSKTGIQSGLMKQYISGLYLLLTSNEELPMALLELKVVELIILLNQSDKNDLLFSLMPESEEKKHLCHLVQESIKDKLTVRDLARKNHMSLSSFKRHFTSHFGISPGRYIREQKLTMARKEILLGKGIKDCYLTYGYESASNFIQAFKRRYGSTPKIFQKQFSQAHYI